MACLGSAQGNRFKEDYKKADGVVRKYIYDSGHNINVFLADGISKKDLIPFGSEKHKLYCLACSKIITAYIEDINILPFEPEELSIYSDFFDFEVEYIQHGILHASLPWKYTPEIILADKVAVSTDYEVKLFTEKYRFRPQDVIPRIMPRLTRLDKTVKPQKKILFAPSWRQYLIGPDIDGKWQPLEELFVNSDYFNGICNFLCSDKLIKLLEQQGYNLDFKLHPIFEVYRHCFNIKSDRIHIVDSAEPIEQYDIFITDFSSFTFDFLYLGRKIFSFIPDEMQFRSGMNGYREIESENIFIKINGEDDLDKLFDQQKPDNKLKFYE